MMPAWLLPPGRLGRRAVGYNCESDLCSDPRCCQRPGAAEHGLRHNAFDRVSVDAPWIEVDTTDGYRPALSEIVAFVNGDSC